MFKSKLSTSNIYLAFVVSLSACMLTMTLTLSPYGERSILELGGLIKEAQLLYCSCTSKPQ